MSADPDYIGREAVRRLNEIYPDAAFYKWPRDSHHTPVRAMCQLLTETGFKEPEPRDLVMARRVCAEVAKAFSDLLGVKVDHATSYLNGDYDTEGDLIAIRALLREYAGEEA